MHSIARLDFGNCEVYGKPGWFTVGRVYCSPRVLWVNEPREVWRPGNEDPLLLSFVQAQEGELRLGLPAGSYTLKLSLYDCAGGARAVQPGGRQRGRPRADGRRRAARGPGRRRRAAGPGRGRAGGRDAHRRRAGAALQGVRGQDLPAQRAGGARAGRRRAADALRRRAKRHPACARRTAGDRPRRSPRRAPRGVRVADGAPPGRWLPGRPGGGPALVVHFGVSHPHAAGGQQDLRRGALSDRGTGGARPLRPRTDAGRRLPAVLSGPRRAGEAARSRTGRHPGQDLDEPGGHRQHGFGAGLRDPLRHGRAAGALPGGGARSTWTIWAPQFQQPSGGFTNGRLAGHDAKWIYSIATGTTALSYAFYAAATGEPGYIEVAERAAEFLVRDWHPDGRPYIWPFDWYFPGSPFYMRVRDIGEQFYILDAIAGVASVSRNETVRRHVFEALRKYLLGSQGLIATWDGAPWWPIQDTWNNSKSAATPLFLAYFLRVAAQYELPRGGAGAGRGDIPGRPALPLHPGPRPPDRRHGE